MHRRPARGVCRPQRCGLCRRREARSGRSMHSDRATERRSARCAQSQASSGRSDRLPTRQTGVLGGRRDSHFSRRTGAEDEGVQRQPPSSTRAALRRTNVQTPRRQQFPRGRPSGELVDPSGHDPCNRDHAPRFLWSGNLGKAKHRYHCHRSKDLKQGACRPPPESVIQRLRARYSHQSASEQTRLTHRRCSPLARACSVSWSAVLRQSCLSRTLPPDCPRK